MPFKGEQDIAYHNISLKLCTIGFRHVCNVTRLQWTGLCCLPFPKLVRKEQKLASGKMEEQMEEQSLVCGYHIAIFSTQFFSFSLMNHNANEVVTNKHFKHTLILMYMECKNVLKISVFRFLCTFSHCFVIIKASF